LFVNTSRNMARTSNLVGRNARLRAIINRARIALSVACKIQKLRKHRDRS
jgi:hypothetical protein